MSGAGAPAPIDPRGPRTNQAVLAVGLVLGLVLRLEWVAPAFAVVLFLGAAFGPAYGPVLRFYVAAIKPRLAPPAELEDPRPPRFAASVGVVVLVGATAAFWAGAEPVGWALVTLVAVLAGVSAVTGLCVGCEMYVWAVRLRGGVRVVTVDREMPEVPAVAEVMEGEVPSGPVGPVGHGRRLAPLPESFRGDGPSWVVFSTEYCAVCPTVVREIERVRPGERVVVLDVAQHLDLASRYRVRRAPTVLRADAEGRVLERLAGVDAVREELARDASAV